MKKLIAIALVLLIACASAVAEGVVTTTASVNLRTGPGLDYEIITAMKPNTKLQYLDATSTDARGVDWYRIAWNGGSAWISSRYSSLEITQTDDAATAPVELPFLGLDATEDIEVSGWYMRPLADAATALGLTQYEEVSSEAPNQYYNASARVGGWDTAEFFDLTGPGYKLFGVGVGTDIETAKARLAAAGLDLYREDWIVVFQHKADEGSFANVDGYDSCVNVTVEDGVVTELDWSTYTG